MCLTRKKIKEKVHEIGSRWKVCCLNSNCCSMKADDNSVGRSSAGDLPAMPLPKPSKRSPSSLAAAGANSDLPRVTRNSRRHRSSVASLDRDKLGSLRRGRRERSATASSSDMSLQEEQPVAEATKQGRRKIKGSSSCVRLVQALKNKSRWREGRGERAAAGKNDER